MRTNRSTVLLATLFCCLYSPKPTFSADEPTCSAGSKCSVEAPELDEKTALRIRNVELEKELGSLREMVGMYRSFVGELEKFSKENTELRVKNAELKAKLEVTEALAAAQFEKSSSEHKLALANERLRRAKAGQPNDPAVAARSTPNQNGNLAEAVQYLQEDLANIRRQLPLMRQSPIPFAVSHSIPSAFDYVPIGPKLKEAECGCEFEGISAADANSETAQTSNRVVK